ncbi:MAG: glycosyltransferase [Acidimicrobiia bacterium]|nr:glycosyltransferase [Acidimicrobiia bacterium]
MNKPPRIVAIGSTIHRNRLGRVFSLWLTARAAGVEFRYFGVDDGSVWEPLRGHEEFLADVQTAPDLAGVEREVAGALGVGATMLVCKPRPELLKLSRKFTGSMPVVVDIDDPELVDPWGDTTLVVRAKRIARSGPSQFRFGWARRTVQGMHVITSNPLLQDLYGGGLVPHVREATSAPTPRPTTAEPFVVAFIGTIREHKGLADIREAVAALAQQRAVQLCITAPPPVDARPWEQWLGNTTLGEGRALLERAHAVAIVSRPGAWGDRQLPVKLIDAMASGVPAVITPRPPLVWAAGGSAIVVRDGWVTDLTDALRLLADDPELGRALGEAAWRRARELFTPTAAAPHLVEALERAADEHETHR